MAKKPMGYFQLLEYLDKRIDELSLLQTKAAREKGLESYEHDHYRVQVLCFKEIRDKATGQG